MIFQRFTITCDKSRVGDVGSFHDAAFKGFMDHTGDIEINYISNSFTWDNGRISPPMVRE